MKLLTSLSLLLCTTLLVAQVPVGGAYQKAEKHNCLSQQHKKQMVERIINSELYSQFEIQPSKQSEPFLSWPIKHEPTATNASDQGYYGISNFVDNNLTFPDQVRDYSCGDRTYDTQWGYNHTGVDIFPWPFPWHKMFDDEMVIVAAAEGIVTDVVDGHFDMNCGALTQSSTPANSVTIRHPNGFYTNYLHLKKNSTVVEVGQFVAAGDKLGIVGSSGISSGPHLHFEVWDEQFRVIEPFYDPEHDECHVHIDNTLWLDQLPYENPGINKVMTAAGIQARPDCIDDIAEETIFAQDQFYYGDTVYCYLFLRDQDLEDNVNIRMFAPDGTSTYQFNINCGTVTSPCTFYNSSFWFFTFVYDETRPCGEYRFQVQFHDEVVSHTFMLEELPALPKITGPLTAQPNNLEQYTVEIYDVGTSFFWYALGGQVVSGEESDTAEVLWRDGDSGSICLIVSSPLGCTREAFCQEVQLAPSATTDLTQKDISVSPNPFSDFIQVHNKTNREIQRIEIYDNSGRLILLDNKVATGDKSVDLSTHTSGVYFFKIFTDKEVVIRKIVKI